MKLAWYRRKWIIVLIHVALWVLLFSLPYLLKPADNGNPSQAPHNVHNDYYYFAIVLIWVCLFYVNANLFIPYFINKKKYRTYFFSLLAFVITLFALNSLFYILFFTTAKFHLKTAALFYLFPCLFFIACSTAFRMLQDRSVQDRLVKEKETENLKTELSFLRSQVSPHFMFNVLNNMVALARKKSDLLEPSLIKLSSLLRYMLYETDEDAVSLDKEIDYLQSYIDLQMQRFGRNLKVNACIEKADPGYSIEPMLLIPFVENAFKHGTGIIEDATIDIKLIAKEGHLNFSVSNKYNHSTEEIKDKTSGIGLNNVKRRLNLLYGDEHSLQISKKDGLFSITLQLNLH